MGTIAPNIIFIFVLTNMPQQLLAKAKQSIFLPDDAFDIVHPNYTEKVEYCTTVKPKARDIMTRFYTLFIYFDQYALNRDFANRYRHVISAMADNAHLKSKHAAYMITVLTPLVFLRDRDDTWCFVEKFERALRHYIAFDPMDTQDNLKHLHRVRGLQDRARAILKRLFLTRNSNENTDTFLEINNSLI